MKKYLLLGISFLMALSLTSCSSHIPGLYRNQIHPDLSGETWRSEVNTTTSQWTRHADRWFKTGDPNSTEIENRHSSYSAAVSTMMVRVPDFTNIKSNGAFQVQIFGTDDHNSVYVFGPNAGVRQTAVAVRGNTLYLTQKPDADKNICKVIIRVGIANLRHLTQFGLGPIEGRQIRSNGLTIQSVGPGDIYLAGDINVKKVMHAGSGSVTVLGTLMPSVEIKSDGRGDVNISGLVGVKSVVQYGTGNINIVGAHTNALRVDACNGGKVGIFGDVIHLTHVVARNNARVYVYCVKSQYLYLDAFDNARIGLAGTVGTLYANTTGFSRFEGRELRSRETYLRASLRSHANVTAEQKVFATGSDDSTVYVYGSPTILSAFPTKDAAIIPIQ